MRTLIKTEVFDTKLKCHCNDQGDILKELRTYEKGTGIIGPNQIYQEFELECYCNMCGALFSENIILKRMAKKGLVSEIIESEKSFSKKQEIKEENPDSAKIFLEEKKIDPYPIPQQIKKWLETK